MSKFGKILIACTITVILIITFGMAASKLGIEGDPVVSKEIEQNIEVIDGKATVEQKEVPLVIPKTGEYMLKLHWESQEGLITGVDIREEDGQSILSCTAESIVMDSAPMELHEGTYTIILSFLTSEEQLHAFLQARQLEEISDNESEPYQYAAQLRENVTYSISVVQYDSVSIMRIYQVFSGILIGILFVFILVVVSIKGDKLKHQYDERQELARGRGAKYAFFVLVAFNTLLTYLGMMQLELPIDHVVLQFIGLLLSVSVYTSYCIWNEAYFALNENQGRVLIGIAFCGLMNIGIGIQNIWNKKIIQDGKVTYPIVNLLCGVMLLVICLITYLKIKRDRKECADEESEA